MTTHPGLFTGTPFVMGSIRGERCWTLREDGMLKSPQYAYDWSTGVNMAYCGGFPRVPSSAMQYLYSQPADRIIKAVQSFLPEDARSVSISIEGYHPRARAPLSWMGRRDEDRPVTITFETEQDWVPDRDTYDRPMARFVNRFVPKPQRPLKMWTSAVREVTLGQVVTAVKAIPHLAEDCSCGFYAYLNGKNDYEQQGRVVGIVEGFGQTFMGTRGFRAQKARILALAVTPDSAKLPLHWGSGSAIYDPARALERVVPKLRRRYPEVAIFNTKEEMLEQFSPTTAEEVEEYREPEAEEAEPV